MTHSGEQLAPSVRCLKIVTAVPADACPPPESATLTPNLNKPSLATWPLMTPWAERDRPVGSAPVPRAHEYGGGSAPGGCGIGEKVAPAPPLCNPRPPNRNGPAAEGGAGGGRGRGGACLQPGAAAGGWPRGRH